MTKSRLKNIDQSEIKKFSALAEQWWDRKGELRALHDINPLRLAYVRERAGLTGKSVLDVGCGGGLLSEAMAVAGACVTGIDMAAKALHAACVHAIGSGVELDYHQSSAEQWVQKHAQQYDVVTCMELLEHVPDPASLVAACARLAKPGGDLFFATVNRTWLARLLVIWAAENVLGIVHKGTHCHAKFVRPKELIRWAEDAGLRLLDLRGVRYIPFIGKAALCNDTRMNYLAHFGK